MVRVKNVSAEGIAVVFRGGKADVQWDDVPTEMLVKIAYGLRNSLSAEELKALVAALLSVGRTADAKRVFRAAKQGAPEKRRRRDRQVTPAASERAAIRRAGQDAPAASGRAAMRRAAADIENYRILARSPGKQGTLARVRSP